MKICVFWYIVKKIVIETTKLVFMYVCFSIIIGAPVALFYWTKEHYPYVAMFALLGIFWAMTSSLILEIKRRLLEMIDEAKQECGE